MRFIHAKNAGRIMIISEKQVYKLMTVCRNFMAVIGSNQKQDDNSVRAYNQIVALLDEITNQQSEELKTIE